MRLVACEVHYMPEATMRLVVCLMVCLILVLTNAAQAQAPSDPQGYCVNRSADFYPYTGEPCKSGYQLGSGNCRKSDGHRLPCQETSALQCPAQSNYRLKAEDVSSTGLKLQNLLNDGELRRE